MKQLVFEFLEGLEQYDEVDPRNRLVAAELERRWNAKLEDLAAAKAKLAELEAEARELGQEEEEAILELGENFEGVWSSEACPIELKKRILRTVVEEVLVDLDGEEKTLQFTIHWKGGTHTRFEMPRPPCGVGRKTDVEDLEIIRRMAVRYGDDEIARVLTKLGRRTATGKRWSEQRVRTVRRRYSIRGQSRREPDAKILTTAEAAACLGVSTKTIRQLVTAGVLKKEQVVPWAPWEIRREDLDSEPVREVLNRFRQTGKLGLGGDGSIVQLTLFEE